MNSELINPAYKDAHKALGEVLDDMLSLRNHWGLFFLKALNSSAQDEPSVVLSSVDIYRIAYELRYQRECTDDYMACNQASIRAALRNGWRKVDSYFSDEIKLLLLSRTEQAEQPAFTVEFVKSLGSGSGNLSTFSYELTPVDTKRAPADLTGAATSVTYRLVAIPKLPFYSRWLRHIPERGVTNTLYWLFLGLFITGSSLFAASVLKNHSGAIQAFALLGLLWAGVTFFVLPFYSVLHNKSALAPFWMQRSKPYLILEQGYDPTNVNAIRLVAYKATCPKCGGQLDLHNGYLQYLGRIISRCDRNPREHVYSFDHVMRNGYEI